MIKEYTTGGYAKEIGINIRKLQRIVKSGTIEQQSDAGIKSITLSGRINIIRADAKAGKKFFERKVK